MADVVAPRNRGQGLARGNPRQCFRLLMAGELGLPAEPNSPCLRTDPPFVGSAQDQMPFKFREAAKDREPLVGHAGSWYPPNYLPAI